MPIIDKLQCLYYDIFHVDTHVTLTSLISVGGKKIHIYLVLEKYLNAITVKVYKSIFQEKKYLTEKVLVFLFLSSFSKFCN